MLIKKDNYKTKEEDIIEAEVIEDRNKKDDL